MAAGGIEGRRIVGAAAAQGYAPALQVGGDEAGGDEDVDIGMRLEGGADVGVAQLDVDLSILSADDLPGIDPEDLVPVGGELACDDAGGEELAEGLDRLRLLGRDGACGEDAVREAVQLVESRVTFADRVCAGGAFEEFLDDAPVDAAQGIDLGLVGTVALGGFGADLDECIADTSPARIFDNKTSLATDIFLFLHAAKAFCAVAPTTGIAPNALSITVGHQFLSCSILFSFIMKIL